jgi:hypothetical protein
MIRRRQKGARGAWVSTPLSQPPLTGWLEEMLVRACTGGHTHLQRTPREIIFVTLHKRPATLDWEDVRFFTVLARRRTIAAAARDLAVTHAQVSRRLTNLESTLGVRLFRRRDGGYSLNAEGAMTLAEAAQMEMAACSLLCRSRAAAPSTPRDAKSSGVTGGPARARRSLRRPGRRTPRESRP